jgi:hypothetical protein
VCVTIPITLRVGVPPSRPLLLSRSRTCPFFRFRTNLACALPLLHLSHLHYIVLNIFAYSRTFTVKYKTGSYSVTYCHGSLVITITISHKQDLRGRFQSLLRVHNIFLHLTTGWLLRAFRRFTSRETDAILHSTQKTSWADDVEDLGKHSCSVSSPPHLFPDQSKGEDYIDDNGIRTTVEYAVNEEGKKVKVCRGDTTSALSLIIRTDHEEDKANSAKVASGACRSGAKNMGQVRA